MTRAERREIEQAFPGLRDTDWEITSPSDFRYNCLAWAVGSTTVVWSPASNEYHWPATVPRENTIHAYEALFSELGFEPTHDEPSSTDVGIAVFGVDQPRHVARHLGNGRWTSKLGRSYDVSHPLRALEGTEYGSVLLMMVRSRRPISATD